MTNEEILKRYEELHKLRFDKFDKCGLATDVIGAIIGAEIITEAIKDNGIEDREYSILQTY